MAFNVDFPFQRRHDAVDNGQAKTGSLAGRFGGEERIEDAWQDVVWDAHAAILDLNNRTARPVGGGGDSDLVVGHIAFRYGLGSIDEQVEEYLGHARLVGVYHWRLAVLAHDLGAVLDLVARHAQCGFHDGTDVDRPDPLAPAASGERAQVAYNVLHALGALARLVQRPVQCFELGHHLVYLVRAPAGQLAGDSLYLAGHVL